jgi:anti-sigma factor RsiW
MKCRHVLSLLEDYHDGEIGRRKALAVEAHLQECRECRVELERLRAEDGLYRRYAEGLERELQAGPGMWESIRPRLERARESRRGTRLFAPFLPASPWARQLLFASAVALLSVAATLIAVRFYAPAAPDSGAPQWAASGESGKAQSLESALRTIHRAEQEYLQAIRVLNAIVEKERPSMDPRLVAEFDRNLKLIDENIAATRAAYYARPQDAYLAQYMLAAYGRKVELLQEVSSE